MQGEYFGLLITFSIIIFILSFFVGLVLSNGKKSKGIGILKTFQVDESGLTGCYLAVQCRAQGLVSYILNLMKLEPTTSLVVSEGVVSIEISSIKGKSKTMTPITQVAGFHGGYTKPFDLIVSGFMFAFIFNIGDWLLVTLGDLFIGLTFFGIAFLLGFVVLYVFSKKLYLGYETSGGEMYMLEFKKGVLGSISVDIDKVNHALDLVNGILHSSALGHNDVQVRPSPQILGKDTTVTVINEPVVQHVVSHIETKPIPVIQEQQPQQEIQNAVSHIETTPAPMTQNQAQIASEEFIGGGNSRVNLYNQFANTSISVGTFEQFDEAMNSHERRINFYNLAQSHNINLGSFEHFEQKICGP